MPRPRRANESTLERNVYFYRASVGLDASGRPKAFDIRPALRHLKTLPFTPEGRYFDVDDAHTICAWPVEISGRSRLVLGTIRRRDLPQMEQAGELTPLRIPASSGLLEKVHMVFLPANIVGLVFNFHGPRMSRLSEYLSEKAGGKAGDVRFAPLIRRNVLAQLRRLGDIRVLQLRVRSSFVDSVKTINQSLGRAFEAALEAGEAEEAEITLRMDGRSRRTLAPGLLADIVRLARARRMRSEVERFTVRGLDESLGRVETIDVLRDLFIVKKQIVRLDERSRALHPDSAFEVIIDAYEDLKGDLEAAAALEDSTE